MYAIIETGGKQYKVEAGDTVFIEKLNVEADAEITFDKVVAVGAEDGMKVGAPYVEGATVTAKAIKNGKAKKITVFTYKQALIQECVYRPVMTKIGRSGLSFDFIHNGVGQPNHQGNGIGRFLQALGFRLGKAHVADAQ